MKHHTILIILLFLANRLLASDVTGTVTNATMPNCPDGAIELTISVGYPPFEFAWVGPNGFTANTEDVTGIKPGIYRVAVEDALCGRVLLEFEVKTDETKIYIAGKKNIPHCGEGGANFGRGSIDLEVTGSGFAYAWTGPNGFASSSQDIENLRAPGIYTVTVTNSTGCTKVLAENICCCSSDTGEGSCSGGQSTPALTVTEDIRAPLTRTSNDGRINLTISGGTSSILIVWTGPNGFKALTEDISNLGPGNYCVAISDGCTQYNKCFNLVPCSESTLTIINVLVTNTCFGFSFGAIAPTATGGAAPYTYQWSNGSTMANLVNIPKGQFCVTVKDNYGCFFKNACFNVGLNEPTEVNSTGNCSRTTLCNNIHVINVESFPVPCAFDDPSECRRENCRCTLTGGLVSSNITRNFTSIRRDITNCTLFGTCPNGQEQVIQRGTTVTGRAVLSGGACTVPRFCVLEGRNFLIGNTPATRTTTTIKDPYNCPDGMWAKSCRRNIFCNGVYQGYECFTCAIPKGTGVAEYEMEDITFGDLLCAMRNAKTIEDSIEFMIPTSMELTITMNDYEALIQNPNTNFRLLTIGEEKTALSCNSQKTAPKQADNTYSKSETLRSNTVIVSPNPFHETLNIGIGLMEDTEVEIKMYNLLGVEVMRRSYNLIKGHNDLSLECTSLQNGAYFIEITTQGNTLQQIRVIRQ